jgi:hypothetical protein
MTTQKKPGEHAESGNESQGLLACGSSGGWHVDVDETTSGPNCWFLQIESPTAYCDFEIPSAQTVREAHEFLSERGAFEIQDGGDSNKHGSLVIGKHPENPAILIRDDEFTDRYFLWIGPKTARTCLTIAGKDLIELTEALRQAVEDLEDDG